MKKYLVLGAGLGMVFAMTSCKSSESAYKKAYEKARQQQAVTAEQEPTTTTEQNTVEVTPTTPVVTSQSTSTDVNSVPVRTETVTVVSGNGLKLYSVVCGSFSLQANAEGLQRTLTNAGYAAQVAYNSGNKMYRVIASPFDDKASAVQSRDGLRATYPEAGLLYKK